MDEDELKFYKDMLKDQLAQIPWTNNPLEDKNLLDNFFWGIYHSGYFCKPIMTYFDKQKPIFEQMDDAMKQLKELIENSIKDFMKV
jgi:hypothetical protein